MVSLRALSTGGSTTTTTTSNVGSSTTSSSSSSSSRGTSHQHEQLINSSSSSILFQLKFTGRTRRRKSGFDATATATSSQPPEEEDNSGNAPTLSSSSDGDESSPPHRQLYATTTTNDDGASPPAAAAAAAVAAPSTNTTTVTLLKMDSTIIDATMNAISNIREFGSDVLQVFNQALYIPKETVYRVSIAALIAEFIHRNCLLPLQHQQHPLAFSWQVSAHLLWVLPALTTVISLSLSLTLLLQWHPAETVVFAGLIALLIVECLTPLAIAGCTALFFVQALTWDSAAVMLATVWVTSAISARCIRVALYPTLGHG